MLPANGVFYGNALWLGMIGLCVVDGFRNAPIWFRISSVCFVRWLANYLSRTWRNGLLFHGGFGTLETSFILRRSNFIQRLSSNPMVLLVTWTSIKDWSLLNRLPDFLLG